MKKEKKIRTYQRRTKSGKMVTVKAHTAKYDAAERAKELAKKKGAGEEIESALSRKKMEALVDAYADKHGLVYEEDGVYSDSKGRNFVLGFTNGKVVKKQVNDFLTANYEATKGKKKKASPVEKEKLPKEPKSSKTKEAKPTTSEPAFTAAEFKEWYQGTGSAADKKVAKALRAQLGRSGYKKLEDEAIDNYSARGHLSMFKRVSSEGGAKEKVAEAKVPKSTKKATEVIESTPKTKTTKKTLSSYSDEDLDYAHRKDIKKVAKVLGLTDVEAASWVIGPNFTEYKESHMKKGEKKAKKYLGKKIFDRLDPSSPDSFIAVLDKAKTNSSAKSEATARKAKTKKSYTTAKRMKPSEVADMTTKRDWIYEG